MKKRIRIVLLMCLIIISSVLLSSCNMLDELKEQRVVMLDEYGDVLEYKGTKYRALPSESNYSINYDEDIGCYIAEKDVPLLLLDTFGMYGRIDTELDLIYCSGEYYCTFEDYEMYSELLKNAKLDHYKIDYFIYDHENYEEKYIVALLDDDVTELINGTIDKVVGTESSYYKDTWECLWIDQCDSEMFLQNTDVFQLYRDIENDVYGLILFAEYSGNYIIKEFPDEHEDAIEEVFRKYYVDGSYEYTYNTYSY